MPGFIRCLALTVTLAALASPALAQTGVTSDPTPVTDPAPAAVSSEAAPSGPTLDNATSGIRANTAHEDLTAAEAAHRAATGSGLSKGAVILIVGGAALAAGVLIGGTGGAALAIGGALVALYGLYLLLQ